MKEKTGRIEIEMSEAYFRWMCRNMKYELIQDDEELIVMKRNPLLSFYDKKRGVTWTEEIVPTLF